MSKMNPMKKNAKNLDLNLGHLVHLVPYWVGCCVAYNYLYVSIFMLTSDEMVMGGNFFHK